MPETIRSLGTLSMLNFPPTTRLEPANVCIYCDATEPDTKLTDEHIIPLSLGGTYVLPKASCLKCAESTKGLEGYAGRRVFQDVRIEHNFPTRRPKERPTELPLRESFSPSPELAPERLIPVKDYPGVLALMWQEPAGILLGHAPDQAATGTPFIREITGRERVERLKAKGIASKIYRELRPDLLARLLAKISFGFAAWGPGLGSFEPVAIREIILRRDTNPFYWVGGTTLTMDAFPASRGPATLHRAIQYMQDIAGIPYLLVQLQLFTYLATPVYTVVIGKLTDSGVQQFRS